MKSDHRTRDMRVIMYSTSSNQHEINECRKLGAENFLVKPPTYEKLIKELETVLKAGSTRQGR